MKTLNFFAFTVGLLLITLLPQRTLAQEVQSPAGVQDQQQIVIKNSDFSSTSKIVLDQEAIRKSKAVNITTLLATTANINISNSAVQPGSIFLRGGDSGHILILVDGLPFYDASTTQRTMNLNEFDIRSVRRIEVVKGSQSVLYGGQALTGVIKIETLPLDVDSNTEAQLEAGRGQYAKAGLNHIQNLNDETAAFLRAAISGKNTKSPVLNSGKDYWGQLRSAELGYFGRGESTDSFVKLGQIYDVNAITESDPSTYKAIDSEGYHSYTDIKSISAGLIGKKWTMRPKLLLGQQASRREFITRPTADQFYGATLTNLRAEIFPFDREYWQMFAGASYSRESFLYRDQSIESVNDFNEQKGLFAKLNFTPLDSLIFETGIRSEIYKGNEKTSTYQMGLTLWKMLKLEYSTGFKSPSLFQLYSTYGNTDLLPEKAQTYTLSFDHKISQQHFYSFTVFETHFNNLITTQGSYPSLKYYNVSRAVTKGAEMQYSFQSVGRLKYDIGVGYQEPWDVTSARWLLKRPLRTTSMRLTKSYDQASAGIEMVSVGERLDRLSSSTYGGLDPYTIFNLFAGHEINKNISLYFRAQNIFDLRYEESSGYHNEGSFYLVGLDLKN